MVIYVQTMAAQDAMKRLLKPVVFSVLLSSLAGCVTETDGIMKNGEVWTGVPVAALNRTTNDVTGLTVNGSQVDISLSPTGGIMMPKVWRPDFMVTIEWDTIYTKGLPSLSSLVAPEKEWIAFSIAFQKSAKARTLHHRITIPVPEYDYYHDFCKLTVHLLTCGQAKLATSCKYPADDDYPLSYLPRKKQIEPPECRPIIPKGM